MRAAFSVVDANGAVRTSASLGVGTLPVDFDVASDGRLVVAFAGQREQAAGQQLDAARRPTGHVRHLSAGDAAGWHGDGPQRGGGRRLRRLRAVRLLTGSLPDPIVAARFNPVTPSELFLLSRKLVRRARVLGRHARRRSAVHGRALGGADVTDTGHALFHTDAGGRHRLRVVATRRAEKTVTSGRSRASVRVALRL